MSPTNSAGKWMELKFLILFLNSSKVWLPFIWGARLLRNRLPRKPKELTTWQVDLAGGKNNKSPRRKL